MADWETCLKEFEKLVVGDTAKSVVITNFVLLGGLQGDEYPRVVAQRFIAMLRILQQYEHRKSAFDELLNFVLVVTSSAEMLREEEFLPRLVHNTPKTRGSNGPPSWRVAEQERQGFLVPDQPSKVVKESGLDPEDGERMTGAGITGF